VAAQVAALRKHGAGKVFREIASGAKTDRGAVNRWREEMPMVEFETTIAAPRDSKAPLYLSEPSATKLSQKLLQQLVYHLWCVLLHPVGYTGQLLHSQISYAALSAVQADRVQRDLVAWISQWTQ
jgi:hypothetical protein